jgi:thioredoxin reductase (NADPH)
LGKTITALHGEAALTGVTLEDDAGGAPSLLPLEGLFVAIGQMPKNGAFSGLAQLTPEGYLSAGEDCKTNIPGLFAAGDCRAKGLRQLTTATADGAVAAVAACAFVDLARES